MRIVAVGAICLAVAACDTPNFKTSQFQFGDSRTLAATGNLRFISERKRKLPFNESTVICSEPSPDYAVGSGTDASGSVKATTTSPVSELTGAFKTTETVMPLGGREKGVLALRDGLYAACQAYANGTIGKDGYSMILSQYGLLLVALLQDQAPVTITGDPKKPANVTVRGATSASAFAALLVSCINDSDPTRRDYAEDDEHRYTHNKLLSASLCGSVLRRAARGMQG